MNIEDLPDDSESSDEDYIPEGLNTELPSEEESDGDVEDDLPSEERPGKRRKRQSKGNFKKNKNQLNEVENEPQKSPLSKEQTNSLWADFMKDTGFKTRAERQQITIQSPAETNKLDDKQPQNSKVETKKVLETHKVTEVYKFAGEEIKIEKEVKINDIVSKNIASGSLSEKKPGGSRLTSILGQLGKTRKITTLEKTKLDWDKYKKEEKIEDELQAYGKSKDGYLERQDFLQRADLRRFEIEKDIRNSIRRTKE